MAKELKVDPGSYLLWTLGKKPQNLVPPPPVDVIPCRLKIAGLIQERKGKKLPCGICVSCFCTKATQVTRPRQQMPLDKLPTCPAEGLGRAGVLQQLTAHSIPLQLLSVSTGSCIACQHNCYILTRYKTTQVFIRPFFPPSSFEGVAHFKII